MADTPEPRPAPGARRARIGIVLLILAVPLAFLDWSAIYTWVAYTAPEESPYGFQIRYRRHSWLPGPGVVVPEQPCPRCRAGDHVRCAGESEELILSAVSPSGTGDLLPPRNLQVTFTGTVQVSSSVLHFEPSPTAPPGTSAAAQARNVIRCSGLSIEGVPIDPSTFTCSCCDGARGVARE